MVLSIINMLGIDETTSACVYAPSSYRVLDAQYDKQENLRMSKHNDKN